MVGNGTSSVSDHPENRSTISNTTIKQYGPIQACWTHRKGGLRSYLFAASYHWEHGCQPRRFTLVAIIGIEPRLPLRLQGCGNKRGSWVSENGTVPFSDTPKSEQRAKIALEMADPIQQKKYLTQSELAERSRTSPSSVKNWRERGHIPYLQFPGSSPIFYPLQGILEAERQFTTPAKEVVSQNERTEIRRKKPDISATRKEWRI